jgi:hypothetical protein
MAMNRASKFAYAFMELLISALCSSRYWAMVRLPICAEYISGLQPVEV